MGETTFTVIRNTAENQFEANIGSHTAFIKYRTVNNKLVLTHTEVPTALSGQGVGSLIVEQTLQLMKASDEKLVPLCPFVQAYIEKHPEWKSLLTSK